MLQQLKEGVGLPPAWTTVEEEVLIRIYKENTENANDEIVNRKRIYTDLSIVESNQQRSSAI